jgi:hypothetical protein
MTGELSQKIWTSRVWKADSTLLYIILDGLQDRRSPAINLPVARYGSSPCYTSSCTANLIVRLQPQVPRRLSQEGTFPESLSQIRIKRVAERSQASLNSLHHSSPLGCLETLHKINHAKPCDWNTGGIPSRWFSEADRQQLLGIRPGSSHSGRIWLAELRLAPLL